MKPLLTIGMAHHSDYDGVYFTIQSIRVNNPELLDVLEFVVIDQTPMVNENGQMKPSAHTEMLKNLMSKIGGKYHYSNWPIGTSPSRNLIFDHATADYVLVLDCHVLLEPYTIRYLIDYFQDLDAVESPRRFDLYHGVFLSDRMGMNGNLATHFADVWRSEMWGIWSVAWQCQKCNTRFQLIMDESGNTGSACTVAMNHQPIDHCSCGTPLPRNIPWAGHEQYLAKEGFICSADTDDPFEIPGQGLGAFLSRRESWLGFNRDADGFGAEEMNIHEKYRKAGRRVLCMPQFKIVHRFGRVNGIPYPLTIEKKVRNYVLWALELGQSLDPIHKHFVVDLKRLSQTQWDKLIADPKGYTQTPELIAKYKAHGSEVVPKKCSSCQQRSIVNNVQAPASSMPIGDMINLIKRGNKPLSLHTDTLIKYGNRCESILDVADVQESTIAFASTKATVDTFQMQNTTFLSGIRQRFADRVKFLVDHQGQAGTIKDRYDLVFLDTAHTVDLMENQLRVLGAAATKYIVIHDTEVFPVILKPIAGFIAENPQWSILEHSHEGNGLIVLGCLPEDKPQAPPEWKQAINFTKALTKHALDGAKNVSEEEYQARLEACNLCPLKIMRKDGEPQCSYCGCPVMKKALWASEDCPHPNGSRWKTPNATKQDDI